MQLHAFLRSYEKYVTPTGNVRVLFTATTDRHDRAYVDLFKMFSFVIPYRQEHFKQDVLSLLPPSGNVIFFVDDQVFIRPWQVSERPNLSLHLAPHLTRSYTCDQPQPLPPFIERFGDDYAWNWADGALDWRYPLSLDGHVFDAAEIRRLLGEIPFHAPNSLESAMQVALPTFLGRQGICYRQSKVVNVPWNRVQKECPNRFGVGPTADEMLDLWESGQQIDLGGIGGVVNESVHQEFEFRTEARS